MSLWQQQEMSEVLQGGNEVPWTAAQGCSQGSLFQKGHKLAVAVTTSVSAAEVGAPGVVLCVFS